MQTRPAETAPQLVRTDSVGHDRPVSWRGIAALVLTALVTLPIAWAAMFAFYSSYEDEGYLVVTLREWARHGGLYTRVFSRYGPAEMFFFGLPQRLVGGEFTFTSGRVATLALWIATSVVLGLTVLIMGNHIVAAVLTQLVSFFLLLSFQNEPMHPGQLVALVLALMVLVMAAVRPRSPSLADGLLGVLTGTLLMTEVNLGVFGMVAIAYVFSSATTLAARRVLRIAGECALVSLGPVLILLGPSNSPSGFTAWWAVKYALVYFSAALVVVILSRLRTVEPASTFDRGAITRFVGWFIASVVFFIGFSVVTGTRLSDFVQGVFLAPLSQSKSFLLAAQISGAALLWLIAPVVLLLSFGWLRKNTNPFGPQPRLFVQLVGATVRIISGVIALVAISRNTPSALSYLPLVGVCLIPPASCSSRPGSMNARRFLAALALTEALHAFPVAGSQVSWSLMLIVPSIALAFLDGCHELAALRPLRAMRPPGILAATLLVALIFVPWPNTRYFTSAQSTLDAYRSGVALNLPGSSGLRLPAWQVTQLRAISHALRRTCSEFVSVPGYDGLYILTGIAPPNGINATVWMYLFTHMQQQSVVNVLKQTRGPVCLVERSGFALGVGGGGVPPLVGGSIDWRTWDWSQPIPPGPLVRYLSRGFVPRIELPPYLILVRAR